VRSAKIDRLKVITHIGALVPLAWILWDYTQGRLTFNPIREIQLRTGKDALILLILTLSVTPINRFLGLQQLSRIRRTLGLYAFAYATLHFLTFIGLDYRFDFDQVYEGVLKKPFAIMGFAAFLILLSLTVTSTRGWVKRLGKNWKRLHRLVYAAALLAVVHFFWLRWSKQNLGEPLIFGGVILLLLALRLTRSLKSR